METAWPARQEGGVDLSSCFQVFSSVSITTTMPYPVDNSTEPALHFPDIPIYSTPFISSTKGFVHHVSRGHLQPGTFDEPGLELFCRLLCTEAPMDPELDCSTQHLLRGEFHYLLSVASREEAEGIAYGQCHFLGVVLSSFP